jgi:hypothetical protein
MKQKSLNNSQTPLCILGCNVKGEIRSLTSRTKNFQTHIKKLLVFNDVGMAAGSGTNEESLSVSFSSASEDLGASTSGAFPLSVAASWGCSAWGGDFGRDFGDFGGDFGDFGGDFGDIGTEYIRS